MFKVLVAEGLITAELITKMRTWKHSGFHVYAGPTITQKVDAVRVGLYIVRAPASSSRLQLAEGGLLKYLAKGSVDRCDPLFEPRPLLFSQFSLRGVRIVRKWQLSSSKRALQRALEKKQFPIRHSRAIAACRKSEGAMSFFEALGRRVHAASAHLHVSLLLTRMSARDNTIEGRQEAMSDVAQCLVADSRVAPAFRRAIVDDDDPVVTAAAISALKNVARGRKAGAVATIAVEILVDVFRTAQDHMTRSLAGAALHHLNWTPQGAKERATLAVMAGGWDMLEEMAREGHREVVISALAEELYASRTTDSALALAKLGAGSEVAARALTEFLAYAERMAAVGLESDDPRTVLAQLHLDRSVVTATWRAIQTKVQTAVAAWDTRGEAAGSGSQAAGQGRASPDDLRAITGQIVPYVEQAEALLAQGLALGEERVRVSLDALIKAGEELDATLSRTYASDQIKPLLVHMRALLERARTVRQGDDIPAARMETKPATRSLNGIVIQFNRAFDGTERFVQSILGSMIAADGRVYRASMSDRTPLRVVVNPKVYDSQSGAALAMVAFRRMLGSRFSLEGMQQADFEGSGGLTGVIYSHWSAH